MCRNECWPQASGQRLSSRRIAIGDLAGLPSPCYVVDQALIERNLRVIDRVQKAGAARVLLALKGFAMWGLFPLVRRYLGGVAASSLNEARLGREKFGGQVHLCAPAYREDEFDELADLSDHITFNSFSQWQRFKDRLVSRPDPPGTGIRINPEHSEVRTAIYDPCTLNSRLGVTVAGFEGQDLEGLSGLHFHTLCELNCDALRRTLEVVEAGFGRYFDGMAWINFGGGHHLTCDDYDVEGLIDLIVDFRDRYGMEVYLEPGEAIALNAGVLVTTVLDIIHNEMDIAILDTSATAHMPDVLEMPYRPQLEGAGRPGEKPHTYRLGGLTCLAGDVIGDYAFDRALRPGDRLVFEDMAHYTMVKNTTFNGVNLPAIAVHDSRTGKTRVVRSFGFEDYRDRLS